MKKDEWRDAIKAQCEKAKTYQDFFDPVIDTLAGILELRDNAKISYEAEGGQVTVEHTNKGGNTNIVKNPALVVLMDCNAQALNYWRELGLTARSYKSMTGSLDIKVETKSLEDMLAEMGI